MSTPGIRIRQKNCAIPKCPQVETEDPHLIIEMLLNGTPLSRVPQHIHSKLLAPLSAAKTENLVAGKVDVARKIQNLMRQLNVSIVKPDPVDLSNIGNKAMTQRCITPPISMISSWKNPQSCEEQIFKYKTELMATDKYWKSEISHFEELKAADFHKMEKKHVIEMSNLLNKQRPKETSRLPSASLPLRQKEKMLLTKKRFEEAAKVRDRAENVEFIENQEIIAKDQNWLEQRKKELKEKQDFEKLTLERQWYDKWIDLQKQMNGEIEQKKHQMKAIGSGMPNEELMRKSLPAGKLSLPPLTSK